MTQARGKLVDPELSRWYHCISGCVRQERLLGEGCEHRKEWLERRLEMLASIFAISVGGYSILDSHLHVLCRLDPKRAEKWTPEEVVRRWGRLYPPRDKRRRPIEVSDQWVQARLEDPEWVAERRRRLMDLGWFTKCYKEPLARMANREDGCRGAFFEGRYKSIAVLDEEALLVIATYIDLNPVAAGMAAMPEEGDFTSFQRRVTHALREQPPGVDWRAALVGTVAASLHAAGLERGIWLCPIEERRRRDSGREGMLEGFPVTSYLLLVDTTGRMRREGKASISREAAGIFERLGVSVDVWRERMRTLWSSGRPWGRYFATSRERLRDAAAQLGRHHLANLGGCAV